MSLWKVILKLKCLHRLVILTVYLLIGAAIFEKLEKTDEPNKVVAERILNATLKKLSLQVGINISYKDFKTTAKDIVKAEVLRNKPDWTYWRAFDFVFIAVSTIGYGDIVPQTSLGRGVFIIYAMIGLPIVMVTINNTGKLLSEMNLSTILAIEKRLLKKEEHPYLAIKCYAASLVQFIVLTTVVGFSYSHYHDTSYTTGIYVTFVTLTTIGFGDFRVSLHGSEEIVYSSPLAITEVPLTLLALTIFACIFNTSVELVGKVHNQIEASCHAEHNKEGTASGTRNELTLQEFDDNSVKPAT